MKKNAGFQQKVCEWADNPKTGPICGQPATHSAHSYTGNPRLDAPFPLCAKHFKMMMPGAATTMIFPAGARLRVIDRKAELPDEVKKFAGQLGVVAIDSEPGGAVIMEFPGHKGSVQFHIDQLELVKL
jgi:hypothetical protein